jgi:hypothetical protein
MLAGEAEGTCISDVTAKPLGIPADENKDMDITYTYTVTFKVHRGFQRDVVYVPMRGGYGGVAGPQPMSTAVHIP